MLFVVGKRSQRGLRLLHVDAQTGAHQLLPMELDTDQPREVVGSSSFPHFVFVFFANRVNVVSPETGELLASSPLPSCEHPSIGARRGRFISQRVQNDLCHWQAIVYQPDNRRVVLETVWRDTAEIKLLGMLDVSGLEGPRGITTKLEIFDPATKSLQHLTVKDRPGEWAVSPPLSLGTVSRDGRRALISCGIQERSTGAVTRGTVLVDLMAQTLTKTYMNAETLEPATPLLARPRTLHGKFIGIGITKDKQLALRSRRRAWWPILHDVGSSTLRFPSQGGQSLAAAQLLVQADFEPVHDFDRGYKLSLAKLPDGSRAWLDGRGLLHLKSADPAVPECTLILCDGPMGGWLADGGVFGDKYWLLLGEQPLPAVEFLRRAITPFIQRVV